MSKFKLFSGDEIIKNTESNSILFPHAGLSEFASLDQIIQNLPNLDMGMPLGVQTGHSWHYVQQMRTDELGVSMVLSNSGFPRVTLRHWNIMLQNCLKDLPGFVRVDGAFNARVIGADVRRSNGPIPWNIHLQLAY